MKFNAYSWPSRARYESVTGCILMVIPRSRSRSIASSPFSSSWRCPIVLVTSSSRSESVVFPWSMCAMMQKMRTKEAARSSAPRTECEIMALLGIVHGARGARDLRRQPADEDDDDQERDVETTDRRNDATDRHQHRLDDPRHVIRPATVQARDPRDHRVQDHRDPKNFQDEAESLPHAARERTHSVAVRRGGRTITSKVS